MPEDSRRPPSSDADIRIREAIRSDIDGLTRLEAEAFASDRLSRRRLAALINSPSASLLVAEREGSLLGYVLVLTRRNSRSARLYSLAVAPACAGRGIGSCLLGAAEAAAAARGAAALRLEVRGDNEAAILLYRRRGYSEIGRRADYYADGMTALRFMRDLRDRGRSEAPSLGRAA